MEKRGLGHKRPLLKRPERALETRSRHDAPPPSRRDERWSLRALAPDLPFVVSVTGSASNAGKTWVCERILEAFAAAHRPAAALKVTRTHMTTCPRENDDCGVCDALTVPWRLVDRAEELDVRGKDTGRYIAAGAAFVRWLLVKPAAVHDAVGAVLPDWPPSAPLVVEGNSFRDHCEADFTLLAVTEDFAPKPSATYVLDRVDRLVGTEAAVAAIAPHFSERGLRLPPRLDPSAVGEAVRAEATRTPARG